MCVDFDANPVAIREGPADRTKIGRQFPRYAMRRFVPSIVASDPKMVQPV
jgi:hypothetical protein